MDTYDLLKTRDLLPKDRFEAPHIRLNPELFDAANCSPEYVFNVCLYFFS